MNEIPIPKVLPRSKSDPTTDVCPVCHGTGWELYRPDKRLFEDTYGDLDIEPAEFAKKCSRCNGYIYQSTDRTGVPEMFSEADMSKFDWGFYEKGITNIKAIITDYFVNFSKWRSQDKGLYLWSKTPGSGKSFLASCIGKSVMTRHNIRFKFVTATDYIKQVGDSYNRERGAEDQTQIYQDCELLVLDDLGAQMDKDWQRQELFRLVNARQGRNLSTIYTSNFPLDKLNVDDRTKSRIAKTSIVIQMPEESIRKKIMDRENQRFLAEIVKERQQ